MIFGSVCSGIEAASVAWLPLGWQCAWVSEIEAFPSQVLAYHYPDTPNHGDMTELPMKVALGEAEAPDVLVGGTPCQSFSVAGLRGGLSDPRGQLTLTYVKLLNEIDIRRSIDGKQSAIAVWENVPAVLSSRDNAFGNFLAALAGEPEALEPPGSRWENFGYVCGPQRSIAWRVLDAQHFGLAQRRKRVFVVASAGAVCPASVLFEFYGMRRDSAPSREAQARTTPGPEGCPRATGFRLVAFGEYADDNTASTMKARDYKDHTDLVMTVHGTQDPITATERAHALGRNNGGENAILQTKIRRLTPVESERLMGFPDNYTQIPWRGRPAPDCPNGHRYKALGNSMAVPIMRWIGERILNESII